MRRTPSLETAQWAREHGKMGKGAAWVCLVLYAANHAIAEIMKKSFPNSLPLLVTHKYF